MLGSPGAGLQNPINSVGPGQPTPTAISSAATHIDPSSMQRAYAALGLPYGNQSPAQVQGQGLGQQKLQGPQHQQLQNMNPLGKKLKRQSCCFWTDYVHLSKVRLICDQPVSCSIMINLLSLSGTNQINQMAGSMGVPSSDQTGMHSDSTLPTTVSKWVLSLLSCHTNQDSCYQMAPFSTYPKKLLRWHEVIFWVDVPFKVAFLLSVSLLWSLS